MDRILSRLTSNRKRSATEKQIKQNPWFFKIRDSSKSHEIILRGFCYCFFIVIVLPREKDARAFSLPELEYNLSLLFDMSESEIVQVDKQYVNCYCVVYQLYCMLTYAHYSAMYWPHLNSFFYILYTAERQPETINLCHPTLPYICRYYTNCTQLNCTTVNSISRVKYKTFHCAELDEMKSVSLHLGRSILVYTSFCFYFFVSDFATKGTSL